jgi:hypothetical protein
MQELHAGESTEDSVVDIWRREKQRKVKDHTLATEI